MRLLKDKGSLLFHIYFQIDNKLICIGKLLASKDFWFDSVDCEQHVIVRCHLWKSSIHDYMPNAISNSMPDVMTNVISDPRSDIISALCNVISDVLSNVMSNVMSQFISGANLPFLMPCPISCLISCLMSYLIMCLMSQHNNPPIAHPWYSVCNVCVHAWVNVCSCVLTCAHLYEFMGIACMCLCVFVCMPFAFGSAHVNTDKFIIVCLHFAWTNTAVLENWVKLNVDTH